ncbi:hypothetical protein DPMN_109647 [Dreissena polymorpha]|uniref:Uncharacterized protein n=1 Tax=Dreissena polymorpha TaxID=45954 RepID=A0A9D4KBE7_DREPO|nr:hypothetical protein DPMN_109647 [Dreissena polymorpha]
MGEETGAYKIALSPMKGNDKDKNTEKTGSVGALNNNDRALHRQIPGRMRHVSYWC